MTAKLVALYTTPDNPEAFHAAYFDTHLPLAEKMPGLQKVEILKNMRNMMGGDAPYYMIAELTFESMDALKTALKSPEGMAAGQNIMGFAGKLVTLLGAPVEEKTLALV